MLLRDISNWTDLENTRGLLFLIQRLDELTFPYSLDSYKSPAMSVQGLLFEAIGLLLDAQLHEAEHLERSLAPLNHVIDEIRFKLRGNYIAKMVSSLDLDQLTLPVRKDEKISELLSRFKLARAEIDNQEYFHEIVASIIVLAKSGKEKQKLDFLAKEFVSFLQNRDVSREHIQNTIIDFFWSKNEINEVSQFIEFCKLVYPHNHNFSVMFGVNDAFASIDEQTLARYSSLVINEEREFPGNEMKERFGESATDFGKKSGHRNICLTFVEATDYTSAVVQAKNQLESVYNFFRLFSHKEDIALSSSALVEQGCCQGIRKEIKTPQNTMHFIRDMRKVKATSTLRRFKEKISLDVSADRHKFENIINIHGMSLSVSSPDIQIVNIWTCLETLAPAEASGSKISQVVSNVVPVLMLGYFNRLTSNLLFDILRWNRRILSKSISKMSNDPGGDLKSKFISLLTSKDNIDARDFLFASYQNFELLRNRTSLIAELLTDRQKAQARLASHESLVKWQIHRIYRARNSIVHSGESPSYTKYLVENAHDFFDQSILFCLEVSAWKSGYSTFSSCFEYAKNMYGIYMTGIKSPKEIPIVWQLPKYRDNSIIFGEET